MVDFLQVQRSRGKSNKVSIGATQSTVVSQDEQLVCCVGSPLKDFKNFRLMYGHDDFGSLKQSNGCDCGLCVIVQLIAIVRGYELRCMDGEDVEEKNLCWAKMCQTPLCDVQQAMQLTSSAASDLRKLVAVGLIDKVLPDYLKPNTCKKLVGVLSKSLKPCP